MTKATLPDGSLADINDCYITIPALNNTKITMNNLPDISDSKGVTYIDESGIGRAMPFKGYQNSDNRAISWTAHFYICKQSDVEKIGNYLRIFEACSYPMTDNTGGAPYAPPPVCMLRCGDQLAWGGLEVCAVLKNYSVKFDRTVPWDEERLTPYQLDVDLQFEVVYDQASLPGAEMIMDFGV